MSTIVDEAFEVRVSTSGAFTETVGVFTDEASAIAEAQRQCELTENRPVGWLRKKPRDKGWVGVVQLSDGLCICSWNLVKPFTWLFKESSQSTEGKDSPNL